MRSPEWLDGYHHGLEDGRRGGAQVSNDDTREISTLKNKIREMESELSRQRAWERSVLADREAAADQGSLKAQISLEEVDSLRSQLNLVKAEAESAGQLKLKLTKNEAEVGELRKALAECLETLRLKESAPEVMENRMVLLESQIQEASHAEEAVMHWQMQAQGLRMELDGALGELHRLRMPNDRASEALKTLQEEKSRDLAKFESELRHERQRFDELQLMLERSQGDGSLVEEARRLTLIERERGDALEQECERMKQTQRETLAESEKLVQSLQTSLEQQRSATSDLEGKALMADRRLFQSESRGEEAVAMSETLRRGELLWQERLNEALHRVSRLEQARAEEASRHDGLLSQLKLELSEAVRLEELAVQRESTAREAESEERRWKEKEIARGDELAKEVNRLRSEVEELRRERTRCDALQALIDSLEVALSEERSRLGAVNAKVSQLTLQLEDSKSQVRRETERADNNASELEHTKELHVSIVNKLRGELAELQAALSRQEQFLMGEMGVLKDEVARLTRLVHELECSNQDLEAKASRSLEDVNSLTVENGKLREQLKALLDEVAGARREGYEIAQNHTTIVTMVAEYRDRLNASEEELDKLKRLLEAELGKEAGMQNALAGLEEENTALRAQNDDLDAQLKAALEELAALRTQLEAIKGEYGELLGKEQTLADLIADLRKKLKQAEEELDKLRGQLAGLTGEFGDLLGKEKSLSELVCTLREMLEAAQEELAGVKLELAECQDQNVDLTVRLESAEGAVLEARAETEDERTDKESALSKLQEAEDEIQRLLRELQASQAKVEELRDAENKLRAADDEIDRLKRELADGQAELAEAKRLFEEQLANLQKEIKDLQKELDAANEELAEAKKALAEAVEDAAGQRRQKEAALAELERLEGELSKLRGELGDAKDDNARLKKRIAELEEEMTVIKKKVTMYEEQIVTLKKTVNTLELNYDELLISHDQLKREHSACAATISELKSSLSKLNEQHEELQALHACCGPELAKLKSQLLKAEDEAVSFKRQLNLALQAVEDITNELSDFKLKHKRLVDLHAKCSSGPSTDTHMLERCKVWVLRNVISTWMNARNVAQAEYFGVWKEVYNMSREDATRQACALQLLRKYMDVLVNDGRRQVLSSWRSLYAMSKVVGGGFEQTYPDDEKDRIYTEALAKAKTEIPMQWECESTTGEWKPHDLAVCAQLEDAIIRQKDQLAVTSQRKSFLMWIHGRTQIDVATGKNHGLRRRRPELVYKTVNPADDLTTVATKLPGSSPGSNKTKGKMSSSPRSPTPRGAKKKP